MQKFLCIHNVAPGCLTRSHIAEFSLAAQKDPDVRGYRTFASLSAGKVISVFDALSRAALASWLDTVGMPYDTITELELEGEWGHVHAV